MYIYMYYSIMSILVELHVMYIFLIKPNLVRWMLLCKNESMFYESKCEFPDKQFSESNCVQSNPGIAITDTFLVACHKAFPLTSRCIVSCNTIYLCTHAHKQWEHADALKRVAHHNKSLQTVMQRMQSNIRLVYICTYASKKKDWDAHVPVHVPATAIISV